MILGRARNQNGISHLWSVWSLSLSEPTVKGGKRGYRRTGGDLIGRDFMFCDKTETNTPDPTDLAHLLFLNLGLGRKETGVKVYSLRERTCCGYLPRGQRAPG